MAARTSTAETLTDACMCKRSTTLIRDGVVVCAICSRRPRVLAEQSPFYDQTNSPLGRRRHLELARKGKFPSTKEGRAILVRREDLHAYLEREGITRAGRKEDEGVEDVLERIQGARR